MPALCKNHCVQDDIKIKHDRTEHTHTHTDGEKDEKYRD